MPQRLPIPHLRTFARLHTASTTDAEDLQVLERHISSAPIPRLDWERLSASRAVTITTAREGESLVGAAVLLQRPRATTAKLLWLAVCPSGRGRGVGTLLLDTVVSAARDAGAAVVTAETLADGGALSKLLAARGFERRDDRGDKSRHELSLWQDAEVNAMASLSLRPYSFSSTTRSATCALMAAMASLDPSMLLTPLMEERVEQEFEAQLPWHSRRPSAALAAVAINRRFEATVWRRSVLTLATRGAKLPITPENLAGSIVSGQIPLVAVRIPRLDRPDERRWRLVTAFGGELFRLVDPQRPDLVQAITRSELRAALATAAFEAVIVGHSARSSASIR